MYFTKTTNVLHPQTRTFHIHACVSRVFVMYVSLFLNVFRMSSLVVGMADLTCENARI